MTGTVKCSACGSEVPAERGPVEIADDGIPVAASIREGLGLPLLAICDGVRFRVMLDSVKVDQAVAFDRRNGVVWRFQTMAGGKLVVREGSVLVEKLTGAVTVEIVEAE